MSNSPSSSIGRADTAVRIAAVVVNFLILQWLGLRLRRAEDPGRVWITARRSLSQAETITTDDVDLSSARPVRRWTLEGGAWPMTGWWSPIRKVRWSADSAIDSAIMLAIGVLLAFLAFAAHAWSLGRQDDEGRGGPTLALTRHSGDAARRSRCVECTQPGDVVAVAISVPVPDLSRGGVRVIRAYLDEEPIASCADCSSLSLRIPSIGRYVVVGAWTPDGSCRLDEGRLDGDLARLAKCDAGVATSEFQAR